MEPNRVGKVTEYKSGHYYVTHCEWEDGHEEVEVHRCQPVLVFHSCDPKEKAFALAEIERLAEEERRADVPVTMISAVREEFRIEKREE